MFSWAETIRPTNSGNVLPGPLQKNSAHPALELCCPKCGLWTSSIDCPRRQLGHGILSLSQTCWLRISRSQMSPAHNTVWEALVSRPCSVILRMHPPQVQPERTRECGHLEPRPLQAVLWAPGPQNPCSHPQCQPPSWGPCPSLTGGQDTAVHGWEECGLSLNLKDRSALAWPADSSGHREGQSQRWEEQGEGAGGWVSPALCCPAFWLGAQCPKPQSARC